MTNDPEATAPAAAADAERLPADTDRPRRIPVAALLNTGALLATTALLLVGNSKWPVSEGD